MSLRTAQRASLVDQVIDQLKEQIVSGAWPLHGKIPTETVLECRQGDGTYVRATSELSGAMLRRLRAAEHLEIFEVRRALEVEAARLAASRRTEEDIKAIKAALEERERAWAACDSAAFVETDLAFHMAVAAATHNRVLIDIYNDFSAALRANITAAGVPLEKTYIPHDGIYEAIAAGDASAAERAGLECMERILASLTESTDLS